MVNKISCSNIVRMHTKIVFCFVLIFYDPVNIFQSSRHCLPVSAADKIEKNAVAPPPVVRLNLATLHYIDMIIHLLIFIDIYNYTKIFFHI